jgi:hypothetical protein
MERNSAHPRVGTVVFRLHAPVPVPRSTTFWVAYGPLAGKFGIIQLLPAGSGQYAGRAALPADDRTVFTYISGIGRMHTRAGWVPRRGGTPIRSVGPTSALAASRIPVRYIPPIG